MRQSSAVVAMLLAMLLQWRRHPPPSARSRGCRCMARSQRQACLRRQRAARAAPRRPRRCGRGRRASSWRAYIVEARPFLISRAPRPRAAKGSAKGKAKLHYVSPGFRSTGGTPVILRNRLRKERGLRGSEKRGDRSRNTAQSPSQRHVSNTLPHGGRPSSRFCRIEALVLGQLVQDRPLRPRDRFVV